MKQTCWILLFVGAFLGSGCLPGDTRPEPGHVFVTAEPTDATVHGFTTDDGWTMRFERILMSLGYLTLGGDDCVVYGQAIYARFFDFAVPGAQKLGEVYGRGPCDLQFVWWTPEQSALLGKGVSEDDFKLLAGKKSGSYVTYIRGSATRNQETKHFEWKFVPIAFLGDCRANPDAQPTTSFVLKGGDNWQPRIEIHAENLLLVSKAGEKKYEFDDFAAADKDEDGEISMLDLGRIRDVDLSTVQTWEISLLSILHHQRLMQMVTFDGSPCRRVDPPADDSTGF